MPGRSASVCDMTTLEEWAAGNYCKYCNHQGLRIEWRLKAKPLGTWSLAGMQDKVVAQKWPWCICDNCKHESEGKL